MRHSAPRVVLLLLLCSSGFSYGSETKPAQADGAPASLERAAYAAWLAGYPTSEEVSPPSDFVDGTAPLVGEPVGPTLVGHAALTVSAIGGAETICPLGGMQLAIGEAQWDNGPPATIGIDQFGDTVLHVPARRRELRLGWSLRGERTPDGCLFRLHFPRASFQRLTLVLPEGLVPVLPGAVIEGPYSTEQAQWIRWHVGVSAREGALLHLLRSDAFAADAQILVAQSTHFDLSQAGVQWRVRFQLHVLDRPVEELRFVVDGDVQIQEATLSQSGAVPGLFQVLPLGGAAGAPGDWTVALPDPLSGSAEVVLRGVTPLVTEARWQLPRLRLAEGMWQQGSVELSVRNPLVLTALDVQQGRQTGSEVTVREGPAERHAFQLHDSDSRISIRLDLERPDLRCRSADRLAWSADALMLTSYGEWSTQGGEVFRLQYDVPSGWEVVQVEAQSRVNDGDWQSQAALLRDWSVTPAGDDEKVLEVHLAEPVTVQSPVRLVVVARRAVRTETLPLGELLRFRARGMRGSELLALTAVGPFGIHAEGLPEALRVREDAPELEEWPEAIPEAAQRFVIRKQRRGSGTTLRLLPQRANHQASVEVQAALLRDSLVETLLLECMPAESRPLRRVLVYFPHASGDTFQWRLRRRVAPESGVSLQRRRLRPELHELWGLPLEGELWEVVLPQAYTHHVTLVARRRRAVQESYEVALPTLPEASEVAGQVAVATSDPDRLRLAPEALMLLTGPAPNRLSGSSRLAEDLSWSLPLESRHAEDGALKQVGVWSYRSSKARLRLGRHGSQPVAARFEPIAHPQAYCSYALVETTAEPGGPSETRITYWLISHGTQQVRLGLPGQARLVGVWVNGRALDADAFGAVAREVVVPLSRSDGLQTLTVRYRERVPGDSGRSVTGWLHCPVPRVLVKLPEVSFSVGAVQWVLLVPEDVRAVTVPASLALQPAGRALSWSERLFGPLGRERGAAPFDPWRRSQWQSLLGRVSAAPPPSLEGVVPLAAPAGGPGAARRLTSLRPGWQRLWLATTMAPPELSLRVVKTASLNLMAIAAFILGLGAGLVVWRVMPRSRSVLVPFLLALSWSFALALPQALSLVGADLALGVLLATAWEGWRYRPPAAGDDLTGSTVRQYAVTASVLVLTAMLIPAALPARLHGEPPEPTLLDSTPHASELQAAQTGVSEQPPSASVRRDGRSVVPPAENQAARERGVGGDAAGRRSAYVLSGGEYNATLVDGHLKMWVVYHVLVLDSGDEAGVRVRVPLSPERAGLLSEWQCTRDGASVPVTMVAEQEALEFRFTEVGDYELTLRMAPLWDAPNGEEVLEWHCPIPPLPQGRFRVKVPPGEGQVAVIGAVGAVERRSENGTTLEAALGSTPELWLERLAAPGEPHIQVNEVFVLDLASPPVLHGWFRYQISGGTDRLYLSLEPGMRAPQVSRAGKPLDVTLLPVPRGAAPVAVIDLGRRESGTFVLHARMPLERFQEARPVGRLRVPKVFSRLVDRRDGVFAVSYSNRLIVRFLRSEDVQAVPSSQLAEMVSDWGSAPLRAMAEGVGLASVWEPRSVSVDLAIRPADAPPLAEQTLSVEVRPDELSLGYHATITPDQASGYQHRLRLSPGLEVEGVTVAPQTLLGRWQRNEDEPGELTLFLRESLANPHTIDLRGFVPGRVAGMPLPRVNLMGVESEAHYIVLYADPSLGAGLEALENLTQLPEFRGVPPQSSDGAPLRAVYRVVAPDYSATITVGSAPEAAREDQPMSEVGRTPERASTVNPSPLPAGATTGAARADETSAGTAEPGGATDVPGGSPPGKAVILLADAVYSLGETGNYVAQMTYWVGSVPGGEIIFRLPARESEIIATTVGGAAVATWREDSGRYHVAFPAPHLPETFVLRWQGKLDWPVALGDVLLPAPHLESAEVRQTIWSLHWPAERGRWTPIEGAQSVDAATREAARLEALLQQAQMLLDYRPELPQAFLEERLERLLNAFAALAKQLPNNPERSSNVETTHIRNLMDRARALAKSRPLSVSWSSPGDPWPVVPVRLGGGTRQGELPEKETATYATASSAQAGATLKVRVVAHPWLHTLRTIAAIAALWLAALIVGIVSRTRWFHAAPAARNVVLLALLGLAWWLWLFPSVAGLLIVLTSPLLGLLLHRRRGVARNPLRAS